MKDPKKLSELIELHLLLKGDDGNVTVEDGNELEYGQEENTSLPPRSEIFPSKKPRLTKIFYNTLFVLFLSLVIGLTVWGARLD